MARFLWVINFFATNGFYVVSVADVCIIVINHGSPVNIDHMDMTVYE